MNANYYVHRTMTGKEFDAVSGLRGYGYSCYVPWVETRSRRGAEQLAYFPGYIFVRNHIVWKEHREAIVFNHFGKMQQIIFGGVSVGGAVIPIPEFELASIARRAAKVRTGDEAEPLSPKFKPGDIGVVKSGPFEGHEVTIEAIDGDAARVALSIFNAVHSIVAPVENLEAA